MPDRAIPATPDDQTVPTGSPEAVARRRFPPGAACTEANRSPGARLVTRQGSNPAATLSRKFHRFTAADADLTVFAALWRAIRGAPPSGAPRATESAPGGFVNAARVLDVLSSTPARPDSRSPCENSHLHALASRIGEISGLSVSTGGSMSGSMSSHAMCDRARARSRFTLRGQSRSVTPRPGASRVRITPSSRRKPPSATSRARSRLPSRSR